MTFPVVNVLKILALQPESSLPPEEERKWYEELAARYLRLSTYLFLAMLYWVTFPWDMSKAASWDWDWPLFLWVRNVIVCGGLYQFWTWFLYVNQREKLAKLKFNPKFPSEEQHRRDRFWSLSGLTISTAFEAVMMHLWATGAVSLYTDFWSRPLWSILHLAYIGHWRDFHFFWIHRVMHPWFRTQKYTLDPGRFLYKYVHALHHKSYNTGPWSGLAMHPVEHLLYYSCTLLPFVFTLHPIHFLFNKLHADVSPLPGHDGFDKPGGGSYFHFIHHAHYDWNFGTPMVPLDKLFGTYSDGSQWRQKKSDS